jgi:hypothetical protein
MCFPTQLRRWETPTLLGPLEGDNFNQWTVISQYVKLLLALANTVILGCECYGTHDYILLCHDSGSCATLVPSAEQKMDPQQMTH